MFYFKVPICTSYMLISPLENTGIFFGNISAINSAQVKVTFSNTLTGDTKDEVTDLSNYTLNNSKGNEIKDVFKAVDVEEGSKEAILTVDFSKIGDDDNEYQNQSSYSLVLDENILGEEVEKEFSVSDFEIPEVVSVEVAGIRTIKVKLSEPVVSKARTTGDLYKDLDEAFEVNNGDYSIEKVEPINNGKELNVVLYSDLKDGEKLNVEVKSEAEDYAGYSLKKGSYDVTVDVNSEDLAVIGYEKAKDNEITLVFNKDVKFADYKDDTKLVKDEVKASYKDDFKAITGTDDNNNDIFEKFYHTTAKNQAEAIEIDGNKLTLHFNSDYSLPETAYVFVEADALQDLWENENNDLNTKVNVTKDLAKPEVKEVKQDNDSNRKIVITFNEDMEIKSCEDEDNYTVTDKDGNNVRVSEAILTDDDEVTLKLSKDLENGDKYKVVIEDVKDVAGNKVEDTTKEFTAKETQAVDDATARYYDAGDSDQKIVVDFGTEMLADGSRYSINNLENYDLEIRDTNDKLLKSINLSNYDDASIKAVNNKTKAEINVPGTKADEDDRWDFSKEYKLTLKINKVDDANENRSDIYTITNLETAGNIELDDAKKSPATTDLETITVTFEEELDFEKDDIILGAYKGTTNLTESTADIYTKAEDGKTDIIDTNKFTVLTPSSTKIEKKDGKTIVTYKLKEANQLAFNGTYEDNDIYVVTTKTTESENSFGDKLIKDTAWKVMDEIAPELAKLVKTDGKSTTEVAKDDKTYKLDDRDDYDDAVKLVEYNVETRVATVELHFEEMLDNDNINKYIFDTDDDDVKVTGAEILNDEDNNKDGIQGKVVTLTLSVNEDEADNYADINNFLGLGITTGTNKVYDMAEASQNGANGAVIDTEIENVDEAAQAAVDAAAAQITSITAPEANTTKLTLPTVDDYTVAIKSSNNEAVIALDGTITPPDAETDVTLTLELTNTTTNKKATTGDIVVTVPAKTN